MVTGDAGLAAAENAALVRRLGKHYLFGLKGNQPTLHDHAVEAIADPASSFLQQLRARPPGRTAELRPPPTHSHEVSSSQLQTGDFESGAGPPENGERNGLYRLKEERHEPLSQRSPEVIASPV